MVLGLKLPLCLFFFLLAGTNSRSMRRRELYHKPNQNSFFKPNGFDPSRVVQFSWRPRAFLYKNFLSNEECDHLISLAKGKLTKSMVLDHENGTSVPSDVRTSSGYFIMKEDDIVKRIAKRTAAWTFLPPENAENLQILRYEHGQKYEPHPDYLYDRVTQESAGQRYATLLMYLSNVQRGGETVFPYSEAKLAQPKDDTWSDCAKNGYAVKPKKGDALLFFSLHINTSTDPDSIHGSCPVIEGEKWSATRWIHVGKFGPLEEQKRVATEGCVDENVNCPQWAASGECDKNPNYMVGSKESSGYCRMSCNVCKP